MSQLLTQDLATAYTAELLSHYGFELHGHPIPALVNRWSNRYPPNWIRWAAVEALYQGRYKALSIEQLLVIWERRDRPIYHFTSEFERSISQRFSPELRSLPPAPPVPQPSRQVASIPEIPIRTTPKRLDPIPPTTGNASLDFGETFVNSDGYEDNLSSLLADSTCSELALTGDSLALTDRDRSSDLEAEIVYQADWCDWEANKRPIDRFTPQRDFSGFYRKLKAIASI